MSSPSSTSLPLPPPSPSPSPRALHWVLRCGSLHKCLDLLQAALGCRVLRHEEFVAGCEATCNGPYGGAWSKTMVGYVPEAQGFALELTYNYGLDSYAFGNDLQYIAVHSPVALRRAAALGFPVSEPEGIIRGPDNYNFKVIPAIPGRAELFVCVAIRVSNLAASVAFWSGVLGMHEVPPHVVPRGLELPASASASALLTFNDNDTYLQFIEFHDGAPVEHAESGGRFAFACASAQAVHDRVRDAAVAVAALEGRNSSGSSSSGSSGSILTPPTRLSTEGKADVVVTILLDPDGYEICFVEDAGFYELARPTYDVPAAALARGV